jgi:hypothetical protein
MFFVGHFGVGRYLMDPTPDPDSQSTVDQNSNPNSDLETHLNLVPGRNPSRKIR